MKKAFLFASWSILIATTITGGIGGFVYDKPVWSIVFIFCGCMAMGGWASFTAWLFGMRRVAAKHLSMSMEDATFISKTIPENRLADFQRTLQHLLESDSEGRRLGGQFDIHNTFDSLSHSDIKIVKLKWSTSTTNDGSLDHFPINAAYLLKHKGIRCAVAVNSLSGTLHANFDYEDIVASSRSEVSIQLFACSIDDAKKVLADIIKQSSQHSVFRRQLIQVTSPVDPLQKSSIRVVNRPVVERDRIVLPENVLKTLERTISSRMKFHGLLEKLGHSSKTGVLLHGSPGTGKTLVAKHLIANSNEQTGIVLGDLQLNSIREAFQLAGYLYPAIIVIEDVDLLAERREVNRNITGLQVLMNELDGLAPTCETIVMMSTNRPEVLEPALAARPGRVSQAIEFPLPDEELRKKLLVMFCSDSADTSQVNFDALVKRTEGASPAFIEELVKRSIIFAAERLNFEEPNLTENFTLQLIDEDFKLAIRELVVDGGKLTKGILGFSDA